MKDDAAAVGRPRRHAHVAARPALAARVVDAGVTRILAHVADVVAGKKRRADLHARAGWNVGRLAGRDVDRHERGVVAGKRIRPPCLERRFDRHAVGEQARAVGRELRAAAEVAGRVDALQAGAVGPDDIDVGGLQRFPSAARHLHRRAAIRREGDPSSIRRPRRAEVAAHSGRGRRGRHGLRPPRPQVHRPDARVAAVARADERQLRAVRRERRLIVVCGIVRQPLAAGAIRLDAKQIRRSFAIGRVDDRGAIGRPRRVVVEARRVEQLPFAAAVGGRDEQADLTRRSERRA